jgi:hypothetical protein
VPPEIRAFEFALGLFTVLIGLAIADVATSLHRLIRHHRQVRWDPLTLLASLFSLLLSIGMWFDLWGIRHASSVRYFFLYLVLVVAFFILFLIAASSLPDEVNGTVDLRNFYEQNRRYFWLLVLAFEVIYVALGFHFVGDLLSHMSGRALFVLTLQWAVPIMVPALLMFVRMRSIHYAGLLILFAIELWHYAPYSIN